MNDGNDSSDSEGEHNYESDDDGELSFESDDEGNYQRNANKVPKDSVNDSDSDFVEDGVDGDEEDEEDEGEVEEEADDDESEDGNDSESDEEANDSDEAEDAEQSDDDASELSFEVESESEEEKTAEKPSSKSLKKGKKASKKDSKKTVNAVEAFKSELNGNEESANGEDEYAKHDTDDEEDIRNTVGNIPMHWYDEYKHIGYDWDAKKIIKPGRRDQLDDFLKRMEDPDFWRTVKDPQTGQEVVLSEEDINLIKRINAGRIPDASYDDYAVREWNAFGLLRCTVAMMALPLVF